MRIWLLLLFFAVSGCSGADPARDPAIAVLAPGTQAVVVLDPGRPKYEGSPSNDTVALRKDKGDIFARYVGLPPGVRVMVGDDVGYYEMTQVEIDENLRDATERKAPGSCAKHMESGETCPLPAAALASRSSEGQGGCRIGRESRNGGRDGTQRPSPAQR